MFENATCLFAAELETEIVLKDSGVIIPKAHRPTVFDLTPDEWRDTYELLAMVKRDMDDRLRPDGFNVGWNCYDVGGQFIPHAHLHVIPRFADEPMAGQGIRYHLKSMANMRPGWNN